MTIEERGDRTLTIVGVVLVVGVLIALGVVILAGINAPDSSAGAPQVNWSVERINASHVRIVHGGGEPVDADGLIVTIDRIRRHPDWEGRLREGSAGVVRAESRQLLRLYWESGVGKRVSLGSWRLE